MSKKVYKEDHSLKTIYTHMKEKGLLYMYRKSTISADTIRDERFANMWVVTEKQIANVFNKREKILMNYLKKNKDKKYMGLNK